MSKKNKLEHLEGKASIIAEPLENWPRKPQSRKGYKVLLLNPPSIPYNRLVEALKNCSVDLRQTVAMPMGLLYIAAVLERDRPGIKMKVVDIAKGFHDYESERQKEEMTIEKFTDMILTKEVPDDFSPDFIGISILFSTAHKSTGDIAKALKTRWPDAPIVVGGMHATNAVSSLLSFPEVDYVCKGEAESIITYFADAMHLNKDGEEVLGIIGRKKLNQCQKNENCNLESAPLIDNLDEIPFPSWHLLNMPDYVDGGESRNRNIDVIMQDRAATIVTTRGCPFHCTFCSSWTVHGRKMRYRSIDNVLDELSILRNRYNVNMVIPEDDLFTVKKPRIIKLCNAVAKKFNKNIHFQFPNGLSVATLDEDVIKAMVNMGMNLANIAIESGSAWVQKHVIKKNCNLDRARKVVQTCRDAGIFVRTYFILGFPGETREQMQETIDFAASISSDWNVFNIASPLIGTEMFEQLIEREDIDTNFNWDDAFFFERSYDTQEITAQEIKDLSYTANIEINFLGNYNQRNGHYERAISLFENILEDYSGHMIAHYCIAMAYKGMGKTKAYLAALNKCHDILIKEKNPMAITQYARFNSLLPDLEIEDEDVLGYFQNMQKNGPRPGMPTRARQSV